MKTIRITQELNKGFSQVKFVVYKVVSRAS